MIKRYKYYHTSFSDRISIITAFMLILGICFMSAGNAFSDNLKGVRISPFKAHYYTENDGKNPGKGNDGTIKDIVSSLQFTETVARPSINFIYSDFNGINSYNFYGVWKGGMTAAADGQSVKAHFDVSKGNVSFYVNNELMEQWKDDDKTVEFSLVKGDNTIRVELHNHWHTTNFNVSFTDYPKLDRTTAVEFFKDIDFTSTKVIYLGAYEAKKDTHNEIMVTLPKSSDPVFLFLNSYRAANWVISNPHNTKVAGVGLRGDSPGSTVANISSSLVYELPASRNAYKSSYSVKAFTGKNADYAFTEYGSDNITIPDFFPTPNYAKGNHASSTLRNSGEDHSDTIPVNQFVETLVVRQKNKTVTETRVVKEPDLDGLFIEGTWNGYIDVSQTTDKSFDILHPGMQIELIIDGRSKWRGNANIPKKIYEHTFKPGRHEIMFVAHPVSDNRPAKLKISITDNAKDLKFDELATILKELGDFDPIYCGVQNSTVEDQTVDIIDNDSEKPIVLFLTSYRQVIWDFEIYNTNKLAAVVTSAKNSSEFIKNLPPKIPVYHFFQLSNTIHLTPAHGLGNINNTFKKAALQILSLTGKLPTGFTGAKQAKTITVPEIMLDREQYLKIGLADVSPDYNIFIEYPKKIDIVFNPVPTRYIDYSSRSTPKRTKKLEPEVQRNSWAEPLGATEDIPTNAFRAYYFDIFNSGQPKFVGIVEDVSINSTRTANVDEYGIIPENFGAFWIGNIALDEDKEMEINIDQGHATTRVLIDNKEVKDRKISLKKGLHKIEIEHVNNWQSYGFSFSLNEPQTLLAYEELKEQLGNILPRRIHTTYVGVYDSKSGDNSITLDIKNVGKPIFLILASSHSVNWVIDGSGAKDIKALLISSMRSKSKIKGNVNQGIPKFYFPMSNYTYQLESKCECQSRYYCPSRDLFDTMDYIATITGRKINSFTGNYNAKSFLVPETNIDKKQFKILKKEAKDNLLAQSKCEGPEFTPQYLKRKQRKQITEHDSAQQALKYMESILDNKFEEFIQFMEPRKRKAKADGIKQRFLFQHNYYAGYDPSIAYHLIDEKMYEKIITNKTKLTIPLVLKRKNLKDYYINFHMNKVRDRWVVSRME